MEETEADCIWRVICWCRQGNQVAAAAAERHSRYRLVLPLRDATTRIVVAPWQPAFEELPPTVRRSLTWDRRVELVRHGDFIAPPASQ